MALGQALSSHYLNLSKQVCIGAVEQALAALKHVMSPTEQVCIGSLE